LGVWEQTEQAARLRPRVKQASRLVWAESCPGKRST
jgi:hypothetical protein